MPALALLSVRPTPLLRAGAAGLEQQVRLQVQWTGNGGAALVTADDGRRGCASVVQLAPGESTLTAFAPVVPAPTTMAFRVSVGSVTADHRQAWQPARRWVVHVVQLSHHDAGYTDLASHVLMQHDDWLDAAIDMAAATARAPDEARFRLVVEQSWSLRHYLHRAPPARAAAMVDLLRRGDVELTALCGNLTTELCGHETLVRAVYPSLTLARDLGLALVSAEHNDIPGFSWGLAQVLVEAGVRLLCPGLPRYYDWGRNEATPVWDEVTLFGARGRPGAFWWEAPGGQRLLFWCNNQGCGGDCRPELPGLADHLQHLAETPYPYTVLRWPVSGGARDNSPYIDGYAATIGRWNRTWAWPRLICSTNARFWRDLVPQLPADLAVWRGELPGQDYPVGAASTAAATAANRRNHADMPVAEALATVAAMAGHGPYPEATLATAWEAMLWHDEHTWGHHFPAGPVARAAAAEKAAHAWRAAALIDDVTVKALARLADTVAVPQPGVYLVVFNAAPRPVSGRVSAPMRELDNCGSTMVATSEGYLRGVLLHDRWHLNPAPELVAGQFELVDLAADQPIPYQLDSLSSPLAPQPHAAERLGLAQGGRRYGVFEVPAGLGRQLSFFAAEVPPLGYRTYWLRPTAAPPAFPAVVTTHDRVLESPWLRLTVDPDRGPVRSLVETRSGRELVATEHEHGFGSVLVRGPAGPLQPAVWHDVRPGAVGAVAGSVTLIGAAPGHPCIEATYTLHAQTARLEVAVHLVKDPTPLLEVYLALPMALTGACRYEGPLCSVDPTTDLLPGAYADRLTAQNWVSVSDGERTMVWSSLDAPVFSLGQLWPGRVSPAHSAVVREDLEHDRPTAAQLRRGVLYWLLCANNFGTNFAVSQSGGMLFRWQAALLAGPPDQGRCAAIGRQLHSPMPTLFTAGSTAAGRPAAAGFLQLDDPHVQLLALRHTAAGVVVRLWNPTTTHRRVRLTTATPIGGGAAVLNLAEEVIEPLRPLAGHSVTVGLPAGRLATLRLGLEGLANRPAAAPQPAGAQAIAGPPGPLTTTA